LFPFFLSAFEEQDVNEKTLWIMNSLDGIESIFPKYKQQLLFLRERERLFNVSSALKDNKENETATQEAISVSSAVNSIGMAVAASTPKKTLISHDIHELYSDEKLTHELVFEAPT
jgi:hypothetical protein